MKIFFIMFLAMILMISLIEQPVFASCAFVSGNVSGSLDGCLGGTDLVNPGDARLDGGFRYTVLNWVTNIARLLSLLAIGAIVYGALLMTLSVGEDEKIKKGKDIVKWSILGFLALISAPALVRIVIEFIYSVA